MINFKTLCSAKNILFPGKRLQCILQERFWKKTRPGKYSSKLQSFPASFLIWALWQLQNRLYAEAGSEFIVVVKLSLSSRVMIDDANQSCLSTTSRYNLLYKKPHWKCNNWECIKKDLFIAFVSVRWKMEEYCIKFTVEWHGICKMRGGEVEVSSK